MEYENKVVIRVGKGSLKLSGRLSKLLGFEKLNRFTTGDQCDLVSSQIVGDRLLPVLRSFTNEFAYGEHVSVDLEPYYVPVTKLDFSSINITLGYREGEILLNTHGRTEVTLHFRKVVA
jgi:hypothetical protein